MDKRRNNKGFDNGYLSKGCYIPTTPIFHFYFGPSIYLLNFNSGILVILVENSIPKSLNSVLPQSKF